MPATSRPTDVREVSATVRDVTGVEFNIEGDPRPDLIALVHEVRPDQCTLVPVREGEITSQAGWSPETPLAALEGVVSGLKRAGIRISVFVDPDPAAISWASTLGADRVELYTEPFARAFKIGGPTRQSSFEQYVAAAQHAHALGLGINAGHDLDLENLALFKTVPARRRDVHRARPHQPRPVRRPRTGRPRLPRGPRLTRESASGFDGAADRVGELGGRCLAAEIARPDIAGLEDTLERLADLRPASCSPM